MARGQTLEKRGAAGGTLSGAGPATVLRHGGSSARRPPRSPIPNLTAGACESAKASPERTGTGRGPALGAESGALPAGQPRPRPPRGATLHLQGGGGRDPLHEAHPYTGPLGGGRAPRPGNAAEAGEPRRSWVPCPPVRGDGAGPLASAPPASAISDSARWRSEAAQILWRESGTCDDPPCG